MYDFVKYVNTTEHLLLLGGLYFHISVIFQCFNDRWIASRMIAEPLNIPKTVVLRILKEDLGKRKLCASFVPHCLTPEQREDRVTSCQDIIAMADADKNFFKQNYYGRWDLVFWCFAYDPKQSDRILNGLVRHPLGRRNWNSEGLA